ncbi:MAG: hypothetical protein D6731_15635 [Planctomycetota bacterium]|nr:MAG: hypothetical protein D6731_15635 [Planctomycetota bacterium]
MTLVELLVAIALGVILIGVVTFVWLQATKLFTTTVNKLETYQRLRTVLDVVERDLANTNRTVDMEFYVDSDPDGPGPANPLRPNGHYDPGDTLYQIGAEDFRKPRDATDPLLSVGTEFGMPGDGFETFPLNKRQQASGEPAYCYAPAVLSPEPYAIGAGYTDWRRYWRDEVYVRTYTMVDGLNRPALVHYRLVPQKDGRSLLRRRVWFLNDNNEMVHPGGPGNPATDRTTILTHGVCDLKVGFYFKETPSEGIGHWYHVGNVDGTWSTEADELNDLDEKRGFVAARGPQGLSKQHQDQFGGMNAVSFVLEGHARLEDQASGGVVLRGLRDDTPIENQPLTDKSQYDPTVNFPGVRSGDKIFVYDATDDDGTQTPGAAKKAGPLFPDRIFTVELIYSDKSETWSAMKFSEPINFFRLGTSWLGSAIGGEVPTQIGDGNPATQDVDPQAGPERLIKQSFNVKFRVGFLPAAFLIRLSCDDPYNRSVLQVERVVRLLEQ